MKDGRRTQVGGGVVRPRALALAVATMVGAGMGLAAPLHAQGGAMDRDAEIRLAMSAGPPSVSEGADVYVFGEEGFERAVAGTNGFACMVVRVAEEPDFLAPHCFNPDAVATVLPGKLAEGRLIAQGLSGEEVEKQLLAGFDDGTLPLPSGMPWAYMLSSGQQLGPAGHWKPHFMLYMPYATNEDVGGSPQMPEYPFVGPTVGHPHSTLVIVMTEFVDPDDVALPKRR